MGIRQRPQTIRGGRWHFVIYLELNKSTVILHLIAMKKTTRPQAVVP